MSEAERFLALAARCEAATGPDAALDMEIHLALGGVRERMPPKYTAYIDAIVWQIERRLPGYGWACFRSGKPEVMPARGTIYCGADWQIDADAALPALGLCAALFRVLARLKGGAR